VACVTLPYAFEAERIRTNNLAAAIIMTAQGKAFIQGGEEMLRSKPDPDNPNGLGVSENTHDQGDYCNRIDWSRLA
jgi:pullulanase